MLQKDQVTIKSKQSIQKPKGVLCTTAKEILKPSNLLEVNTTWALGVSLKLILTGIFVLTNMLVQAYEGHKAETTANPDR